MRRSLFAALLIAVVMTGSLLAPAAAAASHPRYRRMTYLQIVEAKLPGQIIKPTVRTGYGRMRLTHWEVCGPKRCPGHPKRLIMAHRITNHQPTTPPSPAADPFCWPWDWGSLFSGQGCWNNPATWDWPRIWHEWYPGPVVIHGLPGLNSKLMEECHNGIIDGGTYGVAAGKTAQAILSPVKFLLGMGAKLTPQTYAEFALGGCIINIYHKLPGLPARSR